MKIWGNGKIAHEKFQNLISKSSRTQSESVRAGMGVQTVKLSPSRNLELAGLVKRRL